MKNWLQEGKTLDFVNATGAKISSGDPVQVGDMVGVASKDVEDTEAGTFSHSGVYELPKKAAQAIAVGVKVYLRPEGDISTDTDDGDSTNYAQAGYATEAAEAGDATVKVKLLG